MDVSLGDAAAILGLIGGAILYMIHATVAPLQVVLDRVTRSLDKLDATLAEEKPEGDLAWKIHQRWCV